jgi:hypothetical protein
MPYASFSRLCAATRSAKRDALPLNPFRANIGGTFKPRSFDPGAPSTRATDAAAERVARDQRDADALRASYASFRNRCGTFA